MMAPCMPLGRSKEEPTETAKKASPLRVLWARGGPRARERTMAGMLSFLLKKLGWSVRL